MRVRAVVAGIAGLVVVGVLLPPQMATAQWGRGRMMGGGYGEAMEGRYGAPGGGYGYQGGQTP
jgi:hypothetical protein